jgi:hypothetical protein
MGVLNGSHLSPEELLQYFGMQLDARRLVEVELHLGVCAECAANASALYLLEGVRRGLGGAPEMWASVSASLMAKTANCVADVEREWWGRRLDKGFTNLLEGLAAALRSAVRIDVGSGGAVRRFQSAAVPAPRVRGGGSGLTNKFVSAATVASPAGNRQLRVRAEVTGSAEDMPRFAFLAPLAPGREIRPAHLQAIPGQRKVCEVIFEGIAAGEYLVFILPAG